MSSNPQAENSQRAHAPAPWKSEHVSSNSIDIIAADGTIVAILINEEGVSITDAMKANAPVLSAAPDMLAALKAAIAFIGEMQEYKTGHTGAGSIVTQGSGAIAKAEGRL